LGGDAEDQKKSIAVAPVLRKRIRKKESQPKKRKEKESQCSDHFSHGA